ncbi:hypothetical protein PTSG_10923 [Salpingoeca rosetta]|uniref:Major facilitator superfamily (MFS) profile domain-containing protein n=1 Tax=Salpingoeca rosetta (strain ATCC 50818 / BSB-021) TaxID=946362 RepID=F2URE4_SALR5|nr:uncharacterized protein PTSG_10923 [Salpingoeca rosetta]EGD80247.1 hypothetical protein PTSG_10923 [Salpingoeca rosetta]|eukprot:XP_004988309.1 hypothetical protein PTSG_10923 [Salpingoeca rosetta]
MMMDGGDDWSEKKPLLTDDEVETGNDTEKRFYDDVSPYVELTVPEAINRIGYGWQQIRVLLICGLCFCTDSIEIGLLTFLQVEAKHAFDLTDVEESTLSAVVFGGELFGSIFWGPMADRFGRRRAAFLPALMVTGAGLASAFSVDFIMLVALRFLVGFGIGGMGVPYDLLAEFMPSKIRGKALFSIEFFWTFGTLFVNGLAWIMLDRLGWRYLVAVCAAPVAIAMLFFPFLPESPHWLLSVNRSEDALRVVRNAARLNKREDALPPNMRLVRMHNPPVDGKTFVIASSHHEGGVDGGDDEYYRDDAGYHREKNRELTPMLNGTANHKHANSSKHNNTAVSVNSVHNGGGSGSAVASDDDDVADDSGGSMSPLRLFNKANWRATVMLWTIWSTFGFAYYGAVIITPEYFSGWDHKHNSTNGSSIHNDTLFLQQAPVFSLDGNQTHHHHHHHSTGHFDYPALFTAGAAELLGAIVGVLLIDHINRKPLAGVTFIISGVLMVLTIISVPRGVGIMLVVLARMAIFIGSCVVWVVTPELYSTSVRAAGHGWCNGMARLAAFATPYWGDASAVPLYGRLALYGATSIIAGMASFGLPRETRGVALD